MRANRLLSLALATMVGCTAGLPVQVNADDTEIYLGNDAISEGILPNVLFILDTSGSMSNTDGQTKDRMDRMKDALYTILDDFGFSTLERRDTADPADGIGTAEPGLAGAES